MTDRSKNPFAPALLTLPSTLRVHARRPSLMSLISAGGFPTELTGLVWQLASNEISPAQMVASPEELVRTCRLIDAFLAHVLVSPVVQDDADTEITPPSTDDEPATGHVRTADLPDTDKQYLFLYGTGMLRATPVAGAMEARTLETFRDESVRADAGSSGPAVQPASEPDSGAGPAGSAGPESGSGDHGPSPADRADGGDPGPAERVLDRLVGTARD